MPDAAALRALLVLGVLTAVVGAVMCPTQRHTKRLLAHSTIAHIGLLLLVLSTLDSAGIAATGVYLAGHPGVKGALFLLTGIPSTDPAENAARRSTVDEQAGSGLGTRSADRKPLVSPGAGSGSRAGGS